MKRYPETVLFSKSDFTPETIKHLDNDAKLSLDQIMFKTQVYYMRILNPATLDLHAQFVINAKLVRSKSKVGLQTLHLVTDTINTYSLSVDFTEGGTDNVYSLTGRNTAETRKDARKLLLSGLAGSSYLKSIEDTRADTLLAFSKLAVRDMLKPNDERIKVNVPVVNTWLVKLLG